LPALDGLDGTCSTPLSTPVLVKAFWVTAYWPLGAWYDTTYTVFGAIPTGVLKLTCCQPAADSPVKTAWASSVPLLDHRLATWLPVAVVRL
jgi:hypothetical protein